MITRKMRREILGILLRAGRPDLANAAVAMFKVKADRITVDQAYKLLDLDQDQGFTSEELKTAYRNASLKHHPDRGGDPEVMKRVNEAYELLKKVKPGTRVGKEAEKKEQEEQYKQAAVIVKETLDKMFRPDVFSQYFEAQTGKRFTSKVDWHVPTSRYEYYVRFEALWTSEDKETAFTLDVSVNLTDVVYDSKRKLGGGGDDITFPMILVQTQLHNNRKSKFKQSDWNISSRSANIVDPKTLFPAAKIATMMKGKEKGRKFSKRDMLLTLERKLDAHIWTSGKDINAYIPFGPDGIYTLVIHRNTMMGHASWGASGLYRGRPGYKTTVKLASFYKSMPESEATLKTLDELQKHLAKETDDKKVESMVTRALDNIMNAWREGKAA